MRILLQAELLYDFAYRSTSQFVAIDGGLTGSRLAALQVHDTTTKVSTLESVVAIGPHFTLASGWITSHTYLGLSSPNQPTIFNAQTTGQASGVAVTSHRILWEQWSLEAWLGYRQETARVREDCEGITTCVPNSETSSRVVQLALGLGYVMR